LSPFKQYQQRSAAAKILRRLGISEYLLASRQPLIEFVFENGFPVGRAQTLAVDDADATQMPSSAFCEKFTEHEAGLYLIQSMQIQLILSNPVSSSQFSL